MVVRPRCWLSAIIRYFSTDNDDDDDDLHPTKGRAAQRPKGDIFRRLSVCQSLRPRPPGRISPAGLILLRCAPPKQTAQIFNALKIAVPHANVELPELPKVQK